MSEQAQSAEEREDAELVANNPEFDAAYNEALGVEKQKPEKLVEAESEPQPEPEKQTDTVPKSNAEVQVPGDATPVEDNSKTLENANPSEQKPPLTALERAESEGSKLTDAGSLPAPQVEEKSIFELMPEGYKDARDLIATDAFKQWYETAPKHIKKLATEGGVDEACAVIDFFRSHASKVAEKAAASVSPSSAKRFLSEIGDVEMVQSDGSKIRVNDFLKEYGDMGEAVAAIADALASKHVASVKTPASTSVDSKRIEQMEAQIAEFRFWEAVTTEHSDARKIIKSDAWKKFAESASAPIKRLLHSSDPNHAVLALDAFKEQQVAAIKSQSVSTGKDKANKLHADTVRGKSNPPVARKYEDDFDAGFEEALRTAK